MHEHFPRSPLAMQSSCSALFAVWLVGLVGLPNLLLLRFDTKNAVCGANLRCPSLSLSLPSVKMGPFQLLLSTDSLSLSLPPSPRVRGGDVGVARAAKQEKIEPVSNRPRAPATATDQRGVTKAIPCRRTTEIALGSEAFYPPLPLPPPPLPPSHFSSSTFPAR